MLILAMMKIDQFKSNLRIVLRRKLIKRCREIREPETKRQEWMWRRRECKAKANGKKFMNKAEKAFNKIKGRTIWKKYLNSKMQTWNKNIQG